jgi:protein-tyrosine phosphatase
LKRIDFHAHILPELDHGSKSLEISLQQLDWAKRVQVDTIVSTSHFYGWRRDLDDFLEERQKALEIILPEAEQRGLTIIPAAEVTIFRNIADKVDLNALRIGDTSYLLLEMPQETWGNWVYTEIEKIISKAGLQPIIAHLDRYPDRDVESLLEWNLIYQVNADAFKGFWAGRKYVNWVKNNFVQVIGSDVHGGDGQDYLNFEAALKKLGPQYEQSLMKNARRILADKRI